jgi:hypothetical protein
MARKNALMEWLDQTKKLAKSKDYAVLDAIDKIFECIYYLRPRVLVKHAEILSDVCDRYHKPNPIAYIRKRRKTDQLFQDKNGVTLQRFLKRKRVSARASKACLAMRSWRDCPLSQNSVDILNRFVDGSLARLEAQNKDIVWQWFEIIDFMFERPELINPEAIDDYTREQIADVCQKYRKNNPLTNGISKRFGKAWRDAAGRWHPERRHRF